MLEADVYEEEKRREEKRKDDIDGEGQSVMRSVDDRERMNE